LHGNDAVRAARVLLPRINRAGGRPSDIATAVSALERGRSVDELFSDAARTPRESIPFWKRPVENWGPMQGPFVLASSLPTPVRLALEMALHEAEEIAAIADDLLVPPASRAKIDADKPR